MSSCFLFVNSSNRQLIEHDFVFGLTCFTHENTVFTSHSLNRFGIGCSGIDGGLIINRTDLNANRISKALPNLHVIYGNLWIEANNFTDLSFFNVLQTVNAPANGSTASITIYNNPLLTTLGLSSLSDITATLSNSIILYNNPKLCLTEEEISTFLMFQKAFFLNYPLCKANKNYCVVSPYVSRPNQIPDGCQRLNSPILIQDYNGNEDLKGLINLKQVYSTISIINTTISNLTLNLEFIYNQQLQNEPTLTIQNNTLLALFASPKLKRIAGNFSTLDIEIAGNPLLDMSPTDCDHYENQSISLSVSGNKQNCDVATSGNIFYYDIILAIIGFYNILRYHQISFVE